jgi:hypothetical protein
MNDYPCVDCGEETFRRTLSNEPLCKAHWDKSMAWEMLSRGISETEYMLLFVR